MVLAFESFQKVPKLPELEPFEDSSFSQIKSKNCCYFGFDFYIVRLGPGTWTQACQKNFMTCVYL